MYLCSFAHETSLQLLFRMDEFTTKLMSIIVSGDTRRRKIKGNQKKMYNYLFVWMEILLSKILGSIRVKLDLNICRKSTNAIYSRSITLMHHMGFLVI